MSTSINIFMAYAHEDESLREELEKHLSDLREQGLVEAWYTRRIVAGAEWTQEIDSYLSSAHIILPLVSESFLASGYCQGREIQHALERHRAKEAHVIPIILRLADWYTSPLGFLEPLPPRGMPITSWSNRDEAFAAVDQGLMQAIEMVAGRLTGDQKKEPEQGVRERRKEGSDFEVLHEQAERWIFMAQEELSPVERTMLTNHLNSCPQCSTLHESYQLTRRRLHSLPVITPLASFAPQQEKLHEETKTAIQYGNTLQIQVTGYNKYFEVMPEEIENVELVVEDAFSQVLIALFGEGRVEEVTVSFSKHTVLDLQQCSIQLRAQCSYSNFTLLPRTVENMELMLKRHLTALLGELVGSVKVDKIMLSHSPARSGKSFGSAFDTAQLYLVDE